MMYKRLSLSGMFFVLLIAIAGTATANGRAEAGPVTQQVPGMSGAKANADGMIKPEMGDHLERAVFAGGCFWGVEAVFERLNGVADVVSGYSGGNAETAQYAKVGTGRTGHAESVEIYFNPDIIEYRQLLDVFFTVAHDPTQLNYQGPDVGTQYRSAVFYVNDEQRKTVETFIATLTNQEKYHDPIVTQVAPLSEFYPAEEYHQDFMARNPRNPYILYWDVPKLEHLEKAFPDLLAGM